MMYDYIFTKIMNVYDLSEKYNLSEDDQVDILHNYRPIIKVNNYDTDIIKEKLSTIKKEFIKENTIFDLEIFNRENTTVLIYYLNQYIDVLERGKAKNWDKYGDDFFHIFKVESDIPEKRLLISNKNITQIELYFKSVLKAFQDFTKEQNNIDKIKNSKYLNIFKELDGFEIFNNNLNDEIKALFNQNILKNEVLNTYYKDYLPKYLTRINELISHLEQMQNELKRNFPDLKTDFENLNTITSKFKKRVLNDLEITLNTVLKSDYERLLFEYLNIINKLETDLKIEGKSISDFFILFYKRIFYIKSNPKPKLNDTEAIDLKNTSTKEIYLGQPTNDNANLFFDFLIEYYRPSETTVVKYVNILHYLKNDADKKYFIFNIKQAEYKILVKGKTGIEIKKFAKSERYKEDERTILNTLENSFLKNKTV
ncbi:hypothetical protein [Flavobacterium sp. LB2P44]|uniref:hypothetical protein n=1 Tax=Flavobacterium sp. LB2P44 TaxID=3401713 RepID=UPI003AB02BA8